VDDQHDRQERFLAEVQPFRGAIRRTAAIYARGAADREDLEAEIVLQLWRSWERFRGEAAFATFLYRVALNTALLWARRAASGPGVDHGVAVEELGSEARDPEDDEDVRRLYAAIRGLKPIDRALVLLALEGRSHREIAEVTGLGTDNVGVRLSRCRARLRRMLAPQDAGRE
jgi:RNA polymerase sigma-70 factor (ECF subfamily)